MAGSGLDYISKSAAYVYAGTSALGWTPTAFVNSMGLKLTDSSIGTSIVITFTAEINNANFPFARSKNVTTNTYLAPGNIGSLAHNVANYVTSSYTVVTQ